MSFEADKVNLNVVTTIFRVPPPLADEDYPTGKWLISTNNEDK